MMRRFPLVALSCAAPLALAACAVGPDYERPAPLSPQASELTAAQGNAQVTAAPLPEHWWRLFDDPVLDRLVEKALAHNTDIRQAQANLKQARALLGAARASILPTSNVTGSATEQRISNPQIQNPIETEFYQVGFDASYELDLFGRVSRSVEAAKGDVGAAQAGLDAARVSIAAETANTYIQACGFAAQASATQETLTLQQRTLDLTQRMFQGGRFSQREVDQATVLVEQARAQLADLQAEQRAALFALATLTGDSAANPDAQVAACTALPKLAAPIPVGDGQALLARRPDVRQAERQLAADTARIGVATAALYPSITFLGSVTLGAANISDLGSNRSLGFSVGPALSWNFPFSGAARARVRQNEAIAEGSLAAFDKAVLTALQETQQALVRLDGAVTREGALDRAYKASESAAGLSDARFRRGADSFLDLLDAQRTQASARATLAAASVARAQAQISLFKALGGGWENAPEATRAPTP